MFSAYITTCRGASRRFLGGPIRYGMRCAAGVEDLAGADDRSADARQPAHLAARGTRKKPGPSHVDFCNGLHGRLAFDGFHVKPVLRPLAHPPTCVNAPVGLVGMRQDAPQRRLPPRSRRATVDRRRAICRTLLLLLPHV